MRANLADPARAVQHPYSSDGCIDRTYVFFDPKSATHNPA